MNRPRIVIDGRDFSNLSEFAELFSRVVLGEQYRWHGHLDAFNDILRGGFGSPEGGFTIVWKNSEKSNVDLGQAFLELVSILRDHGPGGDEAEDGVELVLE